MLLVTDFIFMAVSVSCRALMRCRKAMLSVLCRKMRSVLRSGIWKRFEGEEFELYLNIQLVRAVNTQSRLHKSVI